MMFAFVFTKMLAALSLVSFANAVITTPDAIMGSLSTGSVQGNLMNPTSLMSLLPPTSVTQSMYNAEDGVAASFSGRSQIHFMDSPKNPVSPFNKVCRFQALIMKNLSRDSKTIYTVINKEY